MLLRIYSIGLCVVRLAPDNLQVRMATIAISVMKDMTFRRSGQSRRHTGYVVRTCVPNVPINSPIQYNDALTDENLSQPLERRG